MLLFEVLGLSLTTGNLKMELMWILSQAHCHSPLPSYIWSSNPFLITWPLFLATAQASPLSLITWLLLKGWDRPPPSLPSPSHHLYRSIRVPKVPGVCWVLQTLVQLCLPTHYQASKNGVAVPAASSSQGCFPNGERSPLTPESAWQIEHTHELFPLLTSC